MNQPPIMPNNTINPAFIGAHLLVNLYYENIMRYIDACEILQLDPRFVLHEDDFKQRLVIVHDKIKDQLINIDTFKVAKIRKQDKRIITGLSFLPHSIKIQRTIKKWLL